MPPARQSHVGDKSSFARCPFKVASIETPSYARGTRSDKKRKRDATDSARVPIQEWPFPPFGGSLRRDMDVSYTIEPQQEWLNMKRYNSFVLKHDKYYVEDFVYVASSATAEQQSDVKEDPDQAAVIQLADHWVAKILEVRAADESHVYARVYWMYSSEELPSHTLGKLVSDYCQQELIASNHMGVINVTRVVRHARVKQLADGETVQDEGAIYWRHVVDYRTSVLSLADGRDEFNISNCSEASPVKVETDTHEDYGLLAEQHGAKTTRTAETSCPTGKDTGSSLATRLRPNSAAHGENSASTQALDAEHPLPRRGAVRPTAPAPDVNRASRGTHIPLSAVGDLSQGSSASMRPTSAAMTSTAPVEGPSVIPVYLPAKTQLALLQHLQSILEAACYEHGKRTMRDIFQRRGWDCAESVELSCWTDEFLRQVRSSLAAQHAGEPLRILLRSIADIRHSAVHRHKVSTTGIERFLYDAEALAELLGDAERSRKVCLLRQDMRRILKQLDDWRILSYARLGSILGLREGPHESAAVDELERKFLSRVGKMVEKAIAASSRG
ncbi:hypothetical protein JDV02_007853 [Purpureocillium takamizusanense]|uniref:BAH domain-containing protein n=1 Tax=Purpureocillium takamizusanense TaxID=2060973 RepID=A0A9Q8QNZ1_9HYPO|nr:uncharacterized protein JDV02_007853 [Purpureocillium takamizusanense]UNI21907.1 hypothetical protein JDV02_007853 [Purpureocillium takamizusanense]